METLTLDQRWHGSRVDHYLPRPRAWPAPLGRPGCRFPVPRLQETTWSVSSFTESRTKQNQTMKTSLLTSLATLALALGAFAQSAVLVDNSTATTENQGLSLYTAGNYYSGPYGIQVWELSPPPTGAALTTLLAGINQPVPYSINGYYALAADGFKLEKEVDGETTAGYYFGVGVVNLPDVTPVGGNIVLGLVVWNTSTTFASGFLTPGFELGVIAFPQSTAETTTPPIPTPPDISAGWLTLNGGTGQELVMGYIPEPGLLSLAALGAGLLSIACWRRGKASRTEAGAALANPPRH